MNRLRIMCREGDRQIEWSPDDPASVALAKREFDDWLSRPGRLAFSFKRPHLEEGEKITTFDPHVAEIILVPQMRGG